MIQVLSKKEIMTSILLINLENSSETAIHREIGNPKLINRQSKNSFK